jgi:hypothetical protein
MAIDVLTTLARELPAALASLSAAPDAGELSRNGADRVRRRVSAFGQAKKKN